MKSHAIWMLLLACAGCDDGASVDAEVQFEPEPSAQPEPRPAARQMDHLFIFDGGSEDGGWGTTGVDICGVSSDCGFAVDAHLSLGGGSVCAGQAPDCIVDRADPFAALDDGSACEPASAPSDYVSLGSEGVLTVRFDRSIAGCAVTIVEFVGVDIEPWHAYVCDHQTFAYANCLNAKMPVASAPEGGTATFQVPAE